MVDEDQPHSLGDSMCEFISTNALEIIQWTVICAMMLSIGRLWGTVKK